MENQNFEDIEKVCKELLDESNMYEQDTIEHLIVPILRYLGWNVDGVASGQLVRGNRDTQSSNRNFDLNLYKKRRSNLLSIGIECKVVSKDVPKDLFPFIKDKNTCSSNLEGVNQVISDYFNKKFSAVKYGYTVAVWTNGRTWIVFRESFRQGEGAEVPSYCVNKLCDDNRIKNPQLHYLRFDLFNSDGNINVEAIKDLEAEIGELNFCDCASK